MKNVNCRAGLAMTISAGEKKEPVVHKMAIYRTEYDLSDEQKQKIVKILRIEKNSDLYLSREDLENDTVYCISPHAKAVVNSIVTKIPRGEYFVLNREILKSINRRISYEEIDEIIFALSDCVDNEYTMNLDEEDDRKLYDLLVGMQAD